MTQYGRFEASMITRLIAVAHTLAAADRDWRMLLVVDDFDLLKRREEPRRAALLSAAVQEQQGRLSDAESVSSIRSSSVSRWIFEDYSSADAVTVNPILGSFLARRRAT